MIIVEPDRPDGKGPVIFYAALGVSIAVVLWATLSWLGGLSALPSGIIATATAALVAVVYLMFSATGFEDDA